MNANDIVVAAGCMASPFCVVAGLLGGLLWRLHFALGAFATLGTVWFLTIGLMPIVLLPTIAAAVVWTAIGSAVVGPVVGKRSQPGDSALASAWFRSTA
jgi:hypothetical protein